MEAPGLSLFQGSESIQIGTNSNQIQEEDEEQEDLKRRNEEVSGKNSINYDHSRRMFGILFHKH